MARVGENPCLLARRLARRLCGRRKLFRCHVQVRMLDVSVSAAEGALAENRPASRVFAYFDHGGRNLDFSELLGLSRFIECGDRRLSAGNYLRDRIEISRAD